MDSVLIIPTSPIIQVIIDGFRPVDYWQLSHRRDITSLRMTLLHVIIIAYKPPIPTKETVQT
jgi:hypothetical protein